MELRKDHYVLHMMIDCKMGTLPSSLYTMFWHESLAIQPDRGFFA